MDKPSHPAYAAFMDWTEEIDATGLRCPLPVLRAQRRLRDMAPGAVLRLLATDPMAAIDVPHFCGETGHELVSAVTEDGVSRFLIRRKPQADTPTQP